MSEPDENTREKGGARRFQPWHPEVQFRANVREPLNPRIHVPLLPLDDLDGPRAAMHLTVPQALELARNLIAAVEKFNQRRDIADALRRTEPLYVP